MSMPSDPEDRLRAVIERAYTVFAPYEEVSDFVGCACGSCVSPEENAAIHSKPLRELSPSDLSPLMSSAGFETHDLKHFLPRMLEWIASGEPEKRKARRHAALSTLKHYGEDWTTWPVEERETVRDFLDAWWAAMLQREPEHQYPRYVEAEDTLTAIADVAEGVGPYLALWAKTSTEPALRHLTYMARDNLQSVAVRGRLGSAQWRDGDEQAVRAWLLSPERTTALLHLADSLDGRSSSVDTAVIGETVEALEELQRVAVDLPYFLDEYWGRRFEKFHVELTSFLSSQAVAARVNPGEGVWNRRPQEMRQVLDWLSAPDRTEAMRQFAAERGWQSGWLDALDEVPMLQRVLDSDLPPRKYLYPPRPSIN